MRGVLGRAGEHERVEALLSTYLDGRATSDERTLVERHLAACADCTRNLATLRATVVAVRELPKVHTPRSFALPRSLARPSQAAPWLYPLLRAATTVAAFLFVLTVAGDLFLRSSPTAPAPAAFAPTSIVMQSEPSSAPLATAPTAASEPQKSAPPAAPAPQATPPQPGLAAPGPVTPGIVAAAKVAPPTPVEPPVEQPLPGGGIGGGVGPGAAPVAPEPSSTTLLRESAATPTVTVPAASPSPPLTSIARVPAPQPFADQRQDNVQAARTVVNPLGIAGDVLAALVLILGAATWIVHKRSR